MTPRLDHSRGRAILRVNVRPGAVLVPATTPKDMARRDKVESDQLGQAAGRLVKPWQIGPFMKKMRQTS
jgi:hypothetical protein